MKRLINAAVLLVSFTLGVIGVAVINHYTNAPLPDIPPVALPTTTVIAPIIQLVQPQIKMLKVAAVPADQRQLLFRRIDSLKILL